MNALLFKTNNSNTVVSIQNKLNLLNNDIIVQHNVDYNTVCYNSTCCKLY